MTLLHEPNLELLHPGLSDLGSKWADTLTGPYFLDVDNMGTQLDELMQTAPFISGVREDGKSFSIFMNDATSPLSAIAKAIDAEVRETDDRWKDSRQVTVDSLEPIQENSLYFTYIDTTDEQNPKACGSLMVADMSGGNGSKSDTLAYFKKVYKTSEIPEAMIPKNDRTLWDIVSVMVKDGFRDGVVSAYLYHALYAKACQVAGITAEAPEGNHGVDWITVLSSDEMKNTRRRIGIPFAEVDSVPPVVEANGVEYTFASLSVEDIYPKVAAKIRGYEKSDEGAPRSIGKILLAKAARIALLGDSDATKADLWKIPGARQTAA